MKIKRGKRVKNAIRRYTKHARDNGQKYGFDEHDWDNAIDYFNNQCPYCWENMGDSSTIEHMTPKSQGGDFTVANVIPSCEPCNSAKGDRDIYQFYVDGNNDFTVGKMMHLQGYLNFIERNKKNDEVELERD